MKRLFLTLAIASLTATPVMAGSTTLTKGGKKMSLWCNGGGCYKAAKISTFKKGPKTRLGRGGSRNFRMHVKNFKAQGWK